MYVTAYFSSPILSACCVAKFESKMLARALDFL